MKTKRKQTTKPRILVVGSSNTDFVIRAARLPKPGETLMGEEARSSGGGKGANQAVAAARSGATVIFVGARGDDAWGRTALEHLEREGIDTRHFTVKKKSASGSAFILIGGAGSQNMIVVAGGANDLLSPDDVSEAFKHFPKLDAVVCQLEVPLQTVEKAASLAAKKNIPLILNPAPARKLPASLLARTALLTPNESEAEILTGLSEPEAAAKKLLKLGVGAVALTLGEKGVLLADGNGIRKISAAKVKAVDTVGAGDCFTGWMASGIAAGHSLDEAARRAVRAASISVTRLGAQTSMPYPRDLV